MCSSTPTNPAATARRAAAANASGSASTSAAESSRGAGSVSANGSADGATVCHAPSSAGSGSPPFHGTRHDALRPACPSWIAGTAPCAATNAAIRRHDSTWASSQSPQSPGVMRPSGATAVASATTSPAPPTARLPRCTRCHSFGTPSTAEYWHIGDTKMRLGIVTPRSTSGANSSLRMLTPGTS